MKASLLLFLLSICSISVINAQCPEVKKVETTQHSISITISNTTKNTAAILYVVEGGQPNLLFDNKAQLNNNSFLFTNLTSGNYIIRLNEKGCKPLFIGKEENITVK